MHLFLYSFLSLSILSQLFASVPFKLNPGCSLPQCEESGYQGIYYGSNYVDDKTIHMIFSSLDQLTISIFETPKGLGPIFNYTTLFSKDYSDSILFPDVPPSNSFTLIPRRLIQFNDSKDSGKMTDYSDDSKIFYQQELMDIKVNNETFQHLDPNRPSFKLSIPKINGTLTIDIIYSGESLRDTKFPKLRATPKSYFLNIALQADGFQSSNTRFGLEFYLISFTRDGLKTFSSRYIDDHYTPGIFNVWQLETLGGYYPASMLWKPVVYLTEDRSIESNTLMQIYKLKNNITLDPKIDQGIYRSLYKPSATYVSALNVSLGQANDGFFTKTNYSFIQFSVGLDKLEPDSTKKFVTVALIVSLALPAIVGLVALIFICKRRASQRVLTNYDAIDD